MSVISAPNFKNYQNFQKILIFKSETQVSSLAKGLAKEILNLKEL